MTKRSLSGLLAGVLTLALVAALGGNASAQAPGGRQPVLMEGKKTLFKRVIVRPGATLFPAAAEQGGAPLRPFSVLYVYGESNGFVEVGKSVGATEGFVKSDKLIDWKQTIVAVFNGNRANRERALMFRKSETIDEVLQDVNPRERLNRLRADAAAGRPGDLSVVAIEPDPPVDLRQKFYFFPILSVANKRLGQRVEGRVLQVAALSKTDPVEAPRPDPAAALKDVRLGVVFVTDTTTSMGPYIERVRDAMTRLQGQLANSPVGQKARFGLVGFRQSLQDNTPAVEYHVKTFLRLGKDATAAAFLRELSNVKESKVPTQGFNEDSLGGVYEALKNSDWQDFDIKVIILMTDAGPLLPESGKRLYKPGLGPAEIQRAAEEEKILITVLHLQTAEGATDHAGAKVQYGLLARTKSDPLYIAVPNGALETSTAEFDKISKSIAEATLAWSQGRAAEAPRQADPTTEALRKNLHALELAYLGRRQGTRMPPMFQAYLPDRDLSDPTKEATEIRLILTKNQLDTMAEVTKGIIESAERSTVDSAQFFTQLRMAIATIARNPDRRIDLQAATLGSALGEFLDGLPYASASPVLSIDANMWMQMGAARQAEIRVDLQRKLRFFDEWLKTPANWIALTEGVPEGEKVTAFPMSQLP